MRKIYALSEDVKFAPKGAAGFHYTMGGWAMDSKGEEATVLSSPGMYGVWPVVDWCRGYAMVVMTREMLSEQKPAVFLQLKEAADEVNKNINCN